MSRKHLILVHSFPTNSILLRGLTDFLEDHFTVHFIDLPGFTRQVPPLARISMAGYAAFLEERIRELSLDEYLLGGVSFGFLVATRARLDGRCKAILAMEPFLGPQSLTMGRRQRMVFATVVRTVAALGLSAWVWRSGPFRRRLLRRGPQDRVATVLREIDPRTFFTTASMILSQDAEPDLHALPHVLLINPADRTIDFETVSGWFQARARDLLVLETTVDHYPRELTKEYFEERISRDQIASIFRFVGWEEPRTCG